MDATTKSIQLNTNNITKQADTKAEHKRASERIQAELRPKSDASKWYRDQANRERSEGAQRASEVARQKVTEMLSMAKEFTKEESKSYNQALDKRFEIDSKEF